MTPEGKFTLALLKATHGIVKRDVGLGFLNQEDMRLTINSRKELVLELAAKGMTVRDIAALTKVSKSQIDRDLSPKGTKSVPKGDKVPRKPRTLSPNGGDTVRTETVTALPAPDDPLDEIIGSDEHPELTPEELWYNSFRHHAGESIAMTAYWHREFGNFLKFPIASEVLTLAKQAAEEWTNLANSLESCYETQTSLDQRSAK